MDDALDAIVADSPYSRTDALLAVVGVTAALSAPIAQACLALFVGGAPVDLRLGTVGLTVGPAVWAATIALAIGLSVAEWARALAYAVSTFAVAAAVSFATATLLY